MQYTRTDIIHLLHHTLVLRNMYMIDDLQETGVSPVNTQIGSNQFDDFVECTKIRSYFIMLHGGDEELHCQSKKGWKECICLLSMPEVTDNTSSQQEVSAKSKQV